MFSTIYFYAYWSVIILLKIILEVAIPIAFIVLLVKYMKGKKTKKEKKES